MESLLQKQLRRPPSPSYRNYDQRPTRFLQHPLSSDESHKESWTSNRSSPSSPQVRMRLPGGNTASSAPSAVHTAAADHSNGAASGNGAVVDVLVVLISLLATVFLVIVLPPLLRFLRRRIPVSQKRIDGRYETIESWLITKRARCHDSTCQAIRERFAVNYYGNDSNRSTVGGAADDRRTSNPLLVSPGICTVIKPCTSYDTAETVPQRDGDEHTEGWEIEEEQVLECPICMEPFQPDDIVSWSPSHYPTLTGTESSDRGGRGASATTNPCTHAFHHACIKEWLLRHKECVLCRETFLPVDNLKAPWTFTQKTIQHPSFHLCLDSMVAQSSCTYFCLRDGLVVLNVPLSILPGVEEEQPQAPPNSSGKREMNLIRRLTSNSVKRKELRCTRAVVRTKSRNASSALHEQRLTTTNSSSDVDSSHCAASPSSDQSHNPSDATPDAVTTTEATQNSGLEEQSSSETRGWRDGGERTTPTIPAAIVVSVSVGDNAIEVSTAGQHTVMGEVR